MSVRGYLSIHLSAWVCELLSQSVSAQGDDGRSFGGFRYQRKKKTTRLAV